MFVLRTALSRSNRPTRLRVNAPRSQRTHRRNQHSAQRHGAHAQRQEHHFRSRVADAARYDQQSMKAAAFKFALDCNEIHSVKPRACRTLQYLA